MFSHHQLPVSITTILTSDDLTGGTTDILIQFMAKMDKKFSLGHQIVLYCANNTSTNHGEVGSQYSHNRIWVENI